MIWRPVSFLVILGCVASAKADISWSHSFDASLRTARKSGRLLMVDFYTTWSEPCKQMHKETFADARVAKRAGDFVAVQLDGDKEGRSVARRYGVNAFPEVLFLDAEGKVVGRVPGFRPAEQLLEDMGRATRSAKDFPTFAARLKKDKLDVEALAGLARIYAFRGDGAAAATMLGRAEKADPTNAQGFLAGAMIAVGDHWQMSMHFEEAMPLFAKAAKLAKAASQISYARASLAACLYSLGRYDDAVKELEAVIALPGASAKDKEDARRGIEEIRAASKSK